uniref:Uncharacterized protein n=1 Tax=Hemiselmis andersenii TaxID=464988 RepID=A0A7S1EB50_HEMAN
MRGRFDESGYPVQSEGADRIAYDAEVTPQAKPWMLFQGLTALYVYKRAPRARAALCNSLVAMHNKGYDLEAYLPQLCDLSLREPPSDPSLKKALLTVSSECPTFAFSVWYFLQSVQDECPAQTKPFLYLLEACIFGPPPPPPPPPRRRRPSPGAPLEESRAWTGSPPLVGTGRAVSQS